MHDDAFQRYTEAECETVFTNLFPEGFAGQDVLDDIASAGWESSPFVAVFHPSLEQVYAEAVQFHHNLQALPWRDPSRSPNPRTDA